MRYPTTCSCLGLNALLALPTKEGGNKGIEFKKGAVLLCVHSQNDIFPFSFLSPLYQGKTLSATLAFASLVDFQIARKMTS